jgi:hypothetical protein
MINSRIPERREFLFLACRLARNLSSWRLSILQARQRLEFMIQASLTDIAYTDCMG